MVNPTLLAANLVGVAVFAASGASAGVAKRLDIFGVIFVGVVAALGGGMLRDVLLGAVPPYALTHWPYFTVAMAAALLLFWLHPQFNRLRRTVLILDAAGLGLFTVTGTLQAVAAHLPAIGACAIGLITGIGGGLGRDLLTGEIPLVLRREIYAVPSLLGAGVTVALDRLGMPHSVLIGLTATLIFVVRVLAVSRRWEAPRPPDPPAPAPGPPAPAPGR